MLVGKFPVLLLTSEFDAVKEPGKMWTFIQTNVFPVLIHILIAIVIYFIGTKIIKLLLNLLKKTLTKAKVEAGVLTFLSSTARIALYAVLCFAIFDILGIATTTIITVLGSLGLTIGLALQGSLSNFAGGVLILVLKPYRVGDYIVTCGEQGTVTEIDIFYTKLMTVDNKKVVIPNGTISNSNIVNVSNEPQRRIELILPIAFSSDINQVKALLRALAERNERVLKDQPIDIYIDEFANSSINIGFRVWAKSEDFWELKWQLMEQIKEIFDANHIKIPFNQLDVTINNK